MSSTIEGKKVMWVEDDAFLSDVIAKKLASEKAILFHTANGEEAFAMAEKEVPDIILLDILLPGLDGFEILRQLKKNDKTKGIPVILFSNLGQKTDIDKGKDLGAVKFLVKATVTLDEIVSEIKNTLPEKK